MFRTIRCPSWSVVACWSHMLRIRQSFFRDRFRDNGWTGLWTDTVYDYTHFHSNAHEVPGIEEGRVSLRLGGETGSLLRLKAGDTHLPAGVGHRRVGDDTGLKVVGAYPRGQSHYDITRKGRRVPKIELPSTDLFLGETGRSSASGIRRNARDIERGELDERTKAKG